MHNTKLQSIPVKSVKYSLFWSIFVLVSIFAVSSITLQKATLGLHSERLAGLCNAICNAGLANC